VVEVVAKEGPAGQAGVEKYDILTKFNDQFLVNPQQLAKLVTGSKEGEEVTLSLLRKGKEQAVKVKLGKRESEALQEFAEPQRIEFKPEFRIQPGAQGGIGIQVQGAMVGGAGGQKVQTQQFSDGEHSIVMQIIDGDKRVTVSDKAGNRVFDGPYMTDADKEAVPEEIRKKIERMEKGNTLRMQMRGHGAPMPAVTGDE
jgi:hypothetical protein